MAAKTSSDDWRVFRGDGNVREAKFPEPPPWRLFGEKGRQAEFQIDPPEIDLINAALLLRRPLLITGKPGVGKSSLIYAVARELQLGRVLVWPINTRSTLTSGLYSYDAIGRLQEEELARRTAAEAKPAKSGKRLKEEEEAWEALGKYVRLGPLGEAFLPSDRPRALLIDEIDKSDIDLPNDLLNIFEEGWFEIPVLSRVAKSYPVVPVQREEGEPVPIEGGKVMAREFPFVVLTSNGERDFPQPFLRRCIRLHIEQPDQTKLGKIVAAHLDKAASNEKVKELLKSFHDETKNKDLATDQLLNVAYLISQRGVEFGVNAPEALKVALFQELK